MGRAPNLLSSPALTCLKFCPLLFASMVSSPCFSPCPPVSITAALPPSPGPRLDRLLSPGIFQVLVGVCSEPNFSLPLTQTDFLIVFPETRGIPQRSKRGHTSSMGKSECRVGHESFCEPRSLPTLRPAQAVPLLHGSETANLALFSQQCSLYRSRRYC